jgi:alpha-tubulin suppressor-like RCC1 family protein
MNRFRFLPFVLFLLLGFDAAAASGQTAASAVAVSAGAYHTCVLTAAGGVLCWGYNGDGELGDGTATARQTPIQVSGLATGVAAISSGAYHTCALTSAGAVLCWGYNGDGQLGDGGTTARLTPVPVAGLSSGVIAISAGYQHTCALTWAGAVWCWGYNGYGELGDGTNTARLTPVPSGLSGGVLGITAGGLHTCAWTSGGAVWCWGADGAGQAGSTLGDRLSPGGVSGLTSGVKAVTSGYLHSCALTSSGAVDCWGDDGYGQLGDGSSNPTADPVSVLGSPARSRRLVPAGGTRVRSPWPGWCGAGETTNRANSVMTGRRRSGCSPWR